MAAPTDRLTEAQRACLRLVLDGLEAKEIARALDISPNAVTERLRAARRSLGVSSSREAARLLALQEGRQAYIRIVGQPIGVGDDPELAAPPARPQMETQWLDTQPSMAERQATFEPDYLFMKAPRLGVPFPTAERPRNDFTPVQRLAWVGAIAIGSSLMIGGIAAGSVSVLEALSRLF